MEDFKEIVRFIRTIFNNKEGFIPLHEPLFIGKEREYVLDAIDSTFVSSVGKYVDRFEEEIKKYTGAKYAIACVNGTAALHLSLLIARVKKGDLVITQPLSFVATCNAINYIGADPLFVDVDLETLSLSPSKVAEYLENYSVIKDDGFCYHLHSGRKISACVPMHAFGHPAKLDELVEVCRRFNIALIEDSAESLGSKYQGRQTGTFGLLGIYSFNGNKTITSGGGGVVVTNEGDLGVLGKHLSTQAKVPHKWEFKHDYIGFNYRLPNLNAAFACAQLEQLDRFIINKRELAKEYSLFFKNSRFTFFEEPIDCTSNYWLNCIFLKNLTERDEFLAFTNENGIMTRPAWTLNHQLSMFKDCFVGNLENALWISDRLVNLPSSVRYHA